MRKTERRSFNLEKGAIQAIDKFAEKHGMTKSRVVENAVIEYTDNDRLSRLERKVDDLIDAHSERRGDESPTPPRTPSESPSPKKNYSESPRQTAERLAASIESPDRESPDGEDDASKDYSSSGDEHNSDTYTADELHDIVSDGGEVRIPADRVDKSELPGGVGAKADVLAAILRDKTPNGVLPEDDIHGVIADYLGDTSYYRNTYVPRIQERLYPRYRRKDGRLEKHPKLFTTSASKSAESKATYALSEPVKQVANAAVRDAGTSVGPYPDDELPAESLDDVLDDAVDAGYGGGDGRVGVIRLAQKALDSSRDALVSTNAFDDEDDVDRILDVLAGALEDELVGSTFD